MNPKLILDQLASTFTNPGTGRIHTYQTGASLATPKSEESKNLAAIKRVRKAAKRIHEQNLREEHARAYYSCTSK